MENSEKQDLRLWFYLETSNGQLWGQEILSLKPTQEARCRNSHLSSGLQRPNSSRIQVVGLSGGPLTQAQLEPYRWIDIQSQFSSSTAVTFCKVTMNTELANTEPVLLGEMQGWVLVSLWSQHVHQPIGT